MKKILIIINPVIPHLSRECLAQLSSKSSLNWPSVKKEYLETDKKEIVIQINGKKRGNLDIEKNMKENDIIEKIKKMSLSEKYKR